MYTVLTANGDIKLLYTYITVSALPCILSYHKPCTYRNKHLLTINKTDFSLLTNNYSNLSRARYLPLIIYASLNAAHQFI